MRDRRSLWRPMDHSLRFASEPRRSKGQAALRSSSIASIPNGRFPCDQVVKALGQLPRNDFLQKIKGLKMEQGRLTIDKTTYETSLSGLFAGGDCISRGGEIVDAVQDGKIAARGIDQFLRNRQPKAGANG